MSASEFEDEEGEGYFASISDLMVGILFVFLLMLTVFALNFKDAEEEQKISKQKYDQEVAAKEAAEERAKSKEREAEEQRDLAVRETQAAEAEHRKNAHLQDLLNRAVARMMHDIEGRQNARLRLLESLERTLKDEGVTVILDPDSGVLRLPESLLFEKSQLTLGGGPDAPPAKRQAAQDALNKVSDALASVLPCYVATDVRPGCEARDEATLEGVLLEGHSDRQPYREAGRTLSSEESRDRNDRLSVERALTVFKEIRQRKPLLDEIKNPNGFPLLAVSAYGDRRPVAMRETEEDYQKNRRIDLRFLLSARTSEELQKLIDEIKRLDGP